MLQMPGLNGFRANEGEKCPLGGFTLGKSHLFSWCLLSLPLPTKGTTFNLTLSPLTRGHCAMRERDGRKMWTPQTFLQLFPPYITHIDNRCHRNVNSHMDDREWWKTHTSVRTKGSCRRTKDFNQENFYACHWRPLGHNVIMQHLIQTIKAMKPFATAQGTLHKTDHTLNCLY